MASNGWIKLHRKLQDKGYYHKSQYVHLWVHLLLSANHKPAEYMTNGKIILIKEGQLLTGRKQLSAATGIPESTVEDILKLLENEHQIQQQKTTKYRLITIVNWKEYQESDNKATTKQQQADTNKNDKNDKKEKNGSVAVAPPYEIVKEVPEEEEKRTKSKQTYPRARKIFALFPNRDMSWDINTTECKSGELLADKEAGSVQKAIDYCVKHMGVEGFPIKRLTPYMLITNWERIYEYSTGNR